MESIDKVLEKLKEARKEKGYSHENMAMELSISQAAYTNLEKNASKLTVERLIKISEVVEKPLYYFFEAKPNNIYHQNFSDNSVGGHIENLYQDNKETHARLDSLYEKTIADKDLRIKNLEEQVAALINKLK